MTSASKPRRGSRTLASILGRDQLSHVNYGEIPGRFQSTIQSETFSGVEFEIENAAPTVSARWPADLNNYDAFWAVTPDGSLRNNGIEFVSRPGMNVTDMARAILMLEEVWRHSYPRAEANARTGTHIHLNCLDLTAKEISSVVALYLLFERTFFKASGFRYHNIYCVPLRDSTEKLNTLFAARNDIYLVWRIIRSFSKYAALNLSALHNHGTVEFRHASGVNNPSKILPWLEVVVKFFDFAKQQNIDELLPRLVELNSNSAYESLAREVFPANLIREIGMPNIMMDMIDGCSFLKECLIPAEEANLDPPRGEEQDPGPPPDEEFLDRAFLNRVTTRRVPTRERPELAQAEVAPAQQAAQRGFGQIPVGIERAPDDAFNRIQDAINMLARDRARRNPTPATPTPTPNMIWADDFNEEGGL